MVATVYELSWSRFIRRKRVTWAWLSCTLMSQSQRPIVCWDRWRRYVWSSRWPLQACLMESDISVLKSGWKSVTKPHPWMVVVRWDTRILYIRVPICHYRNMQHWTSTFQGRHTVVCQQKCSQVMTSRALVLVGCQNQSPLDYHPHRLRMN